MRTILSLLLITLSASVFSAPAFAGQEGHQPPKVSPEFEKLKALVGTWEGTAMMHGKEEKVKVTYALTSGGTALVETLSPGTPHEMVTIYANSGKTVNATHYCAGGNQPQWALKKAEGNTFDFEMSGTKGIANKNEPHMHGVKLTFEGNKLKQEWTNFAKGKKDGSLIFDYTKKI